MRFPPDEWSIRLDDLFESTVGDDSTSKLSAEVLVQTDNAARISGCFRILLSGVDTVKLDIPAENILIMGGGQPPTGSRWRRSPRTSSCGPM